MGERAWNTLVFVAAIASGVVGGIFYAFSTFVMAALGQIPSPAGIAAMRQINVTVINPAFMGLFMGVALLSLGLGAASLRRLGRGGGLILAASLLYLLGCFGVTLAGNVPLNDALAGAGPGRLASLWPRYLEVWTDWNHVRTVAPIVSAVLFTLALRRPDHA